MDRGEHEPVTQGWPFTAPESYVIQHGPDFDREAFKLALLELVARGVLSMAETAPSSRERSACTTVLSRGIVSEPPAEPTLLALYRLYRATPSKTFPDGVSGVPVDDLTRSARRQYKSVGQYVTHVVLPALAERGVYRSEARKVLGVIPKTHYELTEAGSAVRADLGRWLARLAVEPTVTTLDDPTRAAELLSNTGPLLLLVPSLLPELQRLAALASSAAHTRPLWLRPPSEGAIGLDRVRTLISSCVDAGNTGDAGPEVVQTESDVWNERAASQPAPDATRSETIQ